MLMQWQHIWQLRWIKGPITGLRFAHGIQSETKFDNTFARQAIPMVWDFAEANPFSNSTGNFQGAVDWVAEVIENLLVMLLVKPHKRRYRYSHDVVYPLISTDPPYYDNIGYADLSDFFYVWLRRSLHNIYPDLFSTMLVPKGRVSCYPLSLWW